MTQQRSWRGMQRPVSAAFLGPLLSMFGARTTRVDEIDVYERDAEAIAALDAELSRVAADHRVRWIARLWIRAAPRNSDEAAEVSSWVSIAIACIPHRLLVLDVPMVGDEILGAEFIPPAPDAQGIEVPLVYARDHVIRATEFARDAEAALHAEPSALEHVGWTHHGEIGETRKVSFWVEKRALERDEVGSLRRYPDTQGLREASAARAVAQVRGFAGSPSGPP